MTAGLADAVMTYHPFAARRAWPTRLPARRRADFAAAGLISLLPAVPAAGPVPAAVPAALLSSSLAGAGPARSAEPGACPCSVVAARAARRRIWRDRHTRPRCPRAGP